MTDTHRKNKTLKPGISTQTKRRLGYGFLITASSASLLFGSFCSLLYTGKLFSTTLALTIGSPWVLAASCFFLTVGVICFAGMGINRYLKRKSEKKSKPSLAKQSQTKQKMETEKLRESITNSVEATSSPKVFNWQQEESDFRALCQQEYEGLKRYWIGQWQFNKNPEKIQERDIKTETAVNKVKKAYRKLAQKCHSDKTNNNDSMMQVLNEIYAKWRNHVTKDSNGHWTIANEFFDDVELLPPVNEGDTNASSEYWKARLAEIDRNQTERRAWLDEREANLERAREEQREIRAEQERIRKEVDKMKKENRELFARADEALEASNKVLIAALGHKGASEDDAESQADGYHFSRKK